MPEVKKSSQNWTQQTVDELDKSIKKPLKPADDMEEDTVDMDVDVDAIYAASGWESPKPSSDSVWDEPEPLPDSAWGGQRPVDFDDNFDGIFSGYRAKVACLILTEELLNGI
jgi:hypothetical protein